MELMHMQTSSGIAPVPGGPRCRHCLAFYMHVHLIMHMTVPQACRWSARAGARSRRAPSPSLPQLVCQHPMSGGRKELPVNLSGLQWGHRVAAAP